MHDKRLVGIIEARNIFASAKITYILYIYKCTHSYIKTWYTLHSFPGITHFAVVTEMTEVALFSFPALRNIGPGPLSVPDYVGAKIVSHRQILRSAYLSDQGVLIYSEQGSGVCTARIVLDIKALQSRENTVALFNPALSGGNTQKTVTPGGFFSNVFGTTASTDEEIDLILNAGTGAYHARTNSVDKKNSEVPKRHDSNFRETTKHADIMRGELGLSPQSHGTDGGKNVSDARTRDAFARSSDAIAALRLKVSERTEKLARQDEQTQEMLRSCEKMNESTAALVDHYKNKKWYEF